MIPTSSDHSEANRPARNIPTGRKPALAKNKPASIKESGMRLNRYLAAAGLGSRRSCEEHILKGRVSVNGSTARDLATRVKVGDDVRISGRVLNAIAPKTILLNKPAGYTTTRSDKFAERTIFDLIPTDTGNLFHVGRLDKESEGLLLLTNDGALAQELMHPSKGVEKEYEVVLDKTFHDRDAAALRKGTWIEGSMARIESVRTIAPNKIEIILHQGLKRQIRIMLGQLGFKVMRLTRTRLGPLTLRGIKIGSYRDLKEEELDSLRKTIANPKVKKATIPRAAVKPKISTKTFATSPLADSDGWAKPSGKPHKLAVKRIPVAKRLETAAFKPARKTSPTRTRANKAS